MLPKDCRAFIFDMDGVLIDSENLYKVIEQSLFAKVGVVIDHDEHVSYQGSSNPVMWGKIREKHKLQIPLDDLVRITEETVIDFFSSLPEIRPMPGVVKLLEVLKDRKIKMALASSATVEVISIVLAKTGLASYFDTVVDCTEAGAGKPDPAIFLLARKKLGISKEKCVIVEDSANGIKAATAAGMFCIAFNGPGAEHQDQSAANWRISRFSEITEKFVKKEEII
ncbi:MAG: HAD family phosphatase [Prolixibacteraceae bacterium]|jgi:HAD superfamily hydrolase (TIGR01509 family)|nr:HAD family phosphatase [Prolixibacteraceae bacterium]